MAVSPERPGEHKINYSRFSYDVSLEDTLNVKTQRRLPANIINNDDKDG
jgi:hypothetical protein